MNSHKVFVTRACVTLMLAAAVLASAPEAPAVQVNWTGSVNNLWSNPGNWTGGATTNNHVVISGGANLPVVLDVSDTIEKIYVDGGSSLNIGPGVTLNAPTGLSATGAFTATSNLISQTGGVVNLRQIYMADGSGSNDTYNLSGTGQATFGPSLNVIATRGTANVNVSGSAVLTLSGQTLLGGFYTSFTGTGAITQTGGTVNVNAPIVNGAGTGTLNLHGGTFNFNSASIDVDNLNVGGASGLTGALDVGAGQTMNVAGTAYVSRLVGGTTSAVVNQTGGTLHTGANFIIGWDPDNSAQYTLSGAGSVLDIDGYWEARFGHVTFTQNDGTVDVGGLFWLGEGYGGTPGDATYDMNGGTLNVGGDLRIGIGSNAIAAFNLDGGTVSAGDLLFAGAASNQMRIENEGILRVLQSAYSEADALADIASGRLASPNALLVSTVSIGGTPYTQVRAIPEPGTLTLLAAGAVCLAFGWRRRRR